jgi:hypothetical protein
LLQQQQQNGIHGTQIGSSVIIYIVQVRGILLMVVMGNDSHASVCGLASDNNHSFSITAAVVVTWNS